FSIDQIKGRLWMTNDHLLALFREHHVIGLHSYRHPTTLALLPAGQQQEEYMLNFKHVHSVTGTAPWAMSHPCNSYGPETLDILKSQGIRIGFRAYANGPYAGSLLELPREDHALVMARMRA